MCIRDRFGVYSNVTADVASLAYYALYALQHRGQESAGIVVNDDGLFRSWRDVGLVSDVFPKERLRSLGLGNIAVGHVRYGTTGSDNKRNVQPILVNHYKGRMALAHNGNLTNSQELRLQLESQGSIFHTTTDSEVIAYIIVQERLKHGSIEEADLIDREDVVISLTHTGYIKRLPVSEYKAQNRGGRGIKGMQTIEEDFIADLLMTTTHHYVMFFTNFGRVYRLKAYEIPEAGRTARGTAIINLLQLAPEEKISAIIPVKDYEKDDNLFMVTRKAVSYTHLTLPTTSRV